MKLSHFLIYYIVFTSAVAGAAVALDAGASRPLLSPHFWLLFAWVAGLTLIAYAISDAAIRRGGAISVYGVLSGLFLRFFGCLAVVVVLLVKFPENKLLTALNVFSLYFLYTVFEVTCLLRNLRDQNRT